MNASAHRFAESGFTLLELLVVLVLAASMIAVVSVNGQAFLNRSRYHEAVRDVTAFLNESRLRAKVRGIPVTVWLNQNDGVLQTSDDRVMRFPEGISVTVRDLPFDRHSSKGLTVFVFNGQGASGGTLLVRRTESAGVQFRVNRLLGSVNSAEFAENL